MTPGPSGAGPAMRSTRQRRSRSRRMGLASEAAIPARRAHSISRSPPADDSSRMGVPAVLSSAANAVARSNPLMPGMCTSLTTRPNGAPAAAATRAAWSAAEPVSDTWTSIPQPDR